MQILINLATQSMLLIDADGTPIRRYAISSAVLGAGEQAGSFQTPRGRHIIRAKIGADQPLNAVFKARRPTGEVWTPALHAEHPQRDWILTRILWLSGTEPGCNRLGCVDSMRRYIYIHGTPDSELIGLPASHGCIRMRNRDVLELFDLVQAGTPVLIEV